MLCQESVESEIIQGGSIKENDINKKTKEEKEAKEWGEEINNKNSAKAIQ